SNSLSFYVMNGEASRWGSEVLNGFQIANTINSIFFTPASAIGSAVAAMAALATGAGKPERAARGVRLGLAAGAASSVVFAAMLIVWAPSFALLFTSEAVPVARATEAMRAYSISIVGFSLFQIIAGAFSGIGRTDVPLVFAVLRIWLLRVPVAFALRLLFPGIGPYSIWISMAVSNFGTAGAALVMYRGIRWDYRALGPLAGAKESPF
ncbi:MAG: MATE family efflux transporter, partial [Spirochaetaceae bacterium]|nr:MATE family efflux transporter [Spirochaetaceae bacterium]